MLNKSARTMMQSANTVTRSANTLKQSASTLTPDAEMLLGGTGLLMRTANPVTEDGKLNPGFRPFGTKTISTFIHKRFQRVSGHQAKL